MKRREIEIKCPNCKKVIRTIEYVIFGNFHGRYDDLEECDWAGEYDKCIRSNKILIEENRNLKKKLKLLIARHKELEGVIKDANK